MMKVNPMQILRALQALFAVIILGLDAYGEWFQLRDSSLTCTVASWFNTSTTLPPVPGPVAFLVFTAVWTLLIIIPYTFIAPRYFPVLATKYPMLAAEASTMLFWFGGFVASADLLRQLDECSGSVCRSAIGGTVLGSFEL
jgi:hypothetical protein